MANELVQTKSIEYSPEQIALIKSQIAPKANDNELKLFLYQCQRTGLDALSRQIYCIHRKDGNVEKMTIQTSIDGFRVVAERSGQYAGQGEPLFIEDHGKLICAKVSVFKFSPTGQRYEAAVGVAYWDEYVQTKDEWVNGNKTGKKTTTAMWAKMPRTMLAKVAEAIGLRKAFPQDLSGLYTSEEMSQADAPAETTNDHVQDINSCPTKEERQLLASLVYLSDLNETEQDAAFEAINTCTSYKKFEQIQFRLESRKKPIDQIQNPSQKQINEHLSVAVGHEIFEGGANEVDKATLKTKK